MTELAAGGTGAEETGLDMIQIGETGIDGATIDEIRLGMTLAVTTGQSRRPPTSTAGAMTLLDPGGRSRRHPRVENADATEGV